MGMAKDSRRYFTRGDDCGTGKSRWMQLVVICGSVQSEFFGSREIIFGFASVDASSTHSQSRISPTMVMVRSDASCTNLVDEQVCQIATDYISRTASVHI